jgi:hypothetical protein
MAFGASAGAIKICLTGYRVAAKHLGWLIRISTTQHFVHGAREELRKVRDLVLAQIETVVGLFLEKGSEFGAMKLLRSIMQHSEGSDQVWSGGGAANVRAVALRALLRKNLLPSLSRRLIHGRRLNLRANTHRKDRG